MNNLTFPNGILPKSSNTRMLSSHDWEFVGGPPEESDTPRDDNAIADSTQLEARARRVLVVDDNVDAAVTLAMLLDSVGTDACVENHPVTALARADIHTFDAFVLDIGLPVIDGHELVRQLRARQCCDDALFVALTGYGSEADRKRSADAGFHHHLTKPVQLGVLFNILGVTGLSD